MKKRLRDSDLPSEDSTFNFTESSNNIECDSKNLSVLDELLCLEDSSSELDSGDSITSIDLGGGVDLESLLGLEDSNLLDSSPATPENIPLISDEFTNIWSALQDSADVSDSEEEGNSEESVEFNLLNLEDSAETSKDIVTVDRPEDVLEVKELCKYRSLTEKTLQKRLEKGNTINSLVFHKKENTLEKSLFLAYLECDEDCGAAVDYLIQKQPKLYSQDDYNQLYILMLNHQSGFKYMLDKMDSDKKNIGKKFQLLEFIQSISLEEGVSESDEVTYISDLSFSADSLTYFYTCGDCSEITESSSPPYLKLSHSTLIHMPIIRCRNCGRVIALRKSQISLVDKGNRTVGKSSKISTTFSAQSPSIEELSDVLQLPSIDVISLTSSKGVCKTPYQIRKKNLLAIYEEELKWLRNYERADREDLLLAVLNVDDSFDFDSEVHRINFSDFSSLNNKLVGILDELQIAWWRNHNKKGKESLDVLGIRKALRDPHRVVLDLTNSREKEHCKYPSSNKDLLDRVIKRNILLSHAFSISRMVVPYLYTFLESKKGVKIPESVLKEFWKVSTDATTVYKSVKDSFIRALKAKEAGDTEDVLPTISINLSVSETKIASFMGSLIESYNNTDLPEILREEYLYSIKNMLSYMESSTYRISLEYLLRLLDPESDEFFNTIFSSIRRNHYVSFIPDIPIITQTLVQGIIEDYKVINTDFLLESVCSENSLGVEFIKKSTSIERTNIFYDIEDTWKKEFNEELPSNIKKVVKNEVFGA